MKRRKKMKLENEIKSNTEKARERKRELERVKR